MGFAEKADDDVSNSNEEEENVEEEKVLIQRSENICGVIIFVRVRNFFF